MECRDDYFFDHGTEQCEHCCDICCKAKAKRTSAACEKDCPKYAQKLRDKIAQQLQNNPHDLNQVPPAARNAVTATSPSAAAIAGAGVSASIIILLLGLVIAKRKTLIRLFRRRGPRPLPVDDPAAAEPLQLGGLRQDTIPLELCGSGSRAVQESGKACGGEGSSWRLLCSQQSASYGEREGEGGEPRAPTVVSMEGRAGTEELATSTSSRRRSEETELKTPQTSLPSLPEMLPETIL